MSLRYPALFFSVTCLISVSMLGHAEQPAATRTKKVLIIGIDGTRPDALKKAETPHLDSLIKDGAFTDSAEILGERYQENDTISGPGWSSILTGVWADKHGVHDNSFKGRNYELFPHFFKHLKRQRPDATTVSLVSWKPISDYTVSEADINLNIPLPRVPGETLDLRESADKLEINTRDGAWHHLLVVRKAGLVNFYLDGRLIAGPVEFREKYDLDGEQFYLGRDTRSGETCFLGQLDGIRFWNRALSDAEIKSSTRITSPEDRRGLLAEYCFDTDGPLGNNAGDSAFDASLVTDQKSFQIVKSANGSSAIEFTDKSGKDHGLKIKLQKPLNNLTIGDFSFEARFRTQHQGRNILLGNYAANVGAFNLELHTDNTVRAYLQPPKPKTPNQLVREDSRDRVMADTASKILREQDPTAMFVYFHQVDSAGHAIGFSPEVTEYVQAIENVDRHLGTILKSLRSREKYDSEDWLILVCTDHGGIRRTHGSGHDIPEIRKVFMIVSGDSAKRGKISKQAYLVDVSVTALTHLLGKVDGKWQLDGKPVGLK